MEALDVTGYEVLLVAYFSSVAYGLSAALRRAALRRVALLRFGAVLCGVGSFYIVK
jgi:hypothetical protein